jgi:DNA-binding NarL/FixJ family response regulator
VGLRVVIVDDSEHFLRACRGLLEREGLDVAGLASTGADAVRRAGETEPDAILVDIDLGDESGFDVARRLDDAYPNVPVLLISADPEEDFAGLMTTGPAIGFLSKSRISAAAVLGVLGVLGDDAAAR